jgi:hypothetical protein
MDVQIHEVMEGPLANAMQEEQMAQNAPGQRIDMVSRTDLCVNSIIVQDIGVGVYDIMNEMNGAEAEKEFDKQFASKGFHDTSTEQMLRVSKAPLVQEIEQKHQHGDDSSSMEMEEISGSDSDSDSDDSSSDQDMMMEGNTHEMTPSVSTTKGSKAKHNKTSKRPLIQDITPIDEDHLSMKEKRAAKQAQKNG